MKRLNYIIAISLSVLFFSACESFIADDIKIRVISIPSWEFFEKQSREYKDSILGDKPKFAIEAGIINGWEKYVPKENFIGMKSFGSSGPYKKLYEYFGITSSNLVKLIKSKI